MVQQYDYEMLGADTFQQLCQALLARTHRDVQCLPVGMPDGGRDASVPSEESPDGIVYQVKFRKPTPNKLATAPEIADWLTGHIQGELEKVQRLANKGAKKYIVMTNAQCSSHEEVGTRDRVQTWLEENVPIPSQVWWRDDIDRRLDSETEIKRTYGLLRDAMGLAELLGVIAPGTVEHEGLRVARTDPRVAALLKYLRHQYQRDKVVKFKQTELEPDLLDVFVDVPASGHQPGDAISRSAIAVQTVARRTDLNDSTLSMWEGILTPRAQSILGERHNSQAAPAAELLLSRNLLDFRTEGAEEDDHARLVLEGAPGQGKSTVAQYICQVHRARLLGLSSEIRRFPKSHISSPLRLPFHVDLRDLSSWLRKEDPFDIKNTGAPVNWVASLEGFLAAQVAHESGGMEFKASDLDAVTSATPVLLMLDGLDEVPDFSDRKSVVNAVNEAVIRMSYTCPSLVTVVTSRPSVFAKTPGFSRRDYDYLTLTDLPLQLVLQYTDGWLRSRKVPHQEAYKIRAVLGEKLGHPHIVDLARNPMQLAILLWLVKRKGTSLPDKRTALYGSYMDTFLDREAEKSNIVRDERDLILEMHGYVAWELHCQAEIGQSRGRIAESKLKILLKKYLAREGYKKPDLLEQLFAGMTLRVMVLTSRVEGTFEFEVQPLREYFAARYLYLTARSSPPGAEQHGSRSDRFEALLRNPYWWNVTRFYAGFSDKGELANLVDLLEALCEEGDFSLVSYPRTAAATLLRDQVFSQGPRSATRVFERVTSLDSLALMLSSQRAMDGLSFGGDGGDIAVEMQSRIQRGISSNSIDLASCRVLALNSDLRSRITWWLDRFNEAKTLYQRKQWFIVASEMQILRGISKSDMSLISQNIEDPALFWRKIASDDVDFEPDEGTAAYGEMMQAMGDVIISHGFTYYSGGSKFNALKRTLSSGSVFSLASYRRILAQNLGLIHLATEGVSDETTSPLGRIMGVLMSLYGTMRDGKQDIEAWQTAYDDLLLILGRECKQTHLFALTAGNVRTRSISKDKGGSLLDRTLPAVYRARYARQRRKDGNWWKVQVDSISSKDDAWFVVAAMLSWASVECLGNNARQLDRWVSDFSPEDLRALTATFGDRIPSPRRPALPLLRGISHQMRYISVLASPGEDFDDRIGVAIRKAISSREYVGIYASFELQCFLRFGQHKLASCLGEVRNAVRLMRKGIDTFETNWYFDKKYTLGEAREILVEPAGMLTQFLSHADTALTSGLSSRAIPLATVANEEGWFDEPS